MNLRIRHAPDTFSVHSNIQTFKNHHRFLTASQNRYVQQTALAIISNINNALIYLPEYICILLQPHITVRPLPQHITSHYRETMRTRGRDCTPSYQKQ